MFSVNVSSVGNVESALVSITATAVILRFSDRPGGSLAMGYAPYFLLGLFELEERLWAFNSGDSEGGPKLRQEQRPVFWGQPHDPPAGGGQR